MVVDVTSAVPCTWRSIYQPALSQATRKRPQGMCEHPSPRSLARCCSKKQQQAPQLFLFSFCIKIESYSAPWPNPLQGFPKPGPEHSLCQIPQNLRQIPYPARLAAGTRVRHAFSLCVCLRGYTAPLCGFPQYMVLDAPTFHAFPGFPSGSLWVDGGDP